MFPSLTEPNAINSFVGNPEPSCYFWTSEFIFERDNFSNVVLFQCGVMMSLSARGAAFSFSICDIICGSA